MARYRRIPTEIEAIRFEPGAPLPDGVRVQASPAGEGKPYAVWNHEHASWVGLEAGDMIRVDLAPQDVYPISAPYFEDTYEPVEDG